MCAELVSDWWGLSEWWVNMVNDCIQLFVSTRSLNSDLEALRVYATLETDVACTTHACVITFWSTPSLNSDLEALQLYAMLESDVACTTHAQRYHFFVTLPL